MTLATPLPASHPTVHIDRIVLTDDDRLAPDPASVASLAADIKIRGLINPITVRLIKGGEYELIAGRRRHAACQLAGLQLVPISIVQADDQQVAAIRLAENVHRLQLNPLEEAMAVASMAEHVDGTREQKVTLLSTRMGMSVSWVRDRIYIASLTKKVQKLLSTGRLTLMHGRELAKCADPRVQEELAQRYAGSEDGLKQPGDLRDLQGEVKKKMRSLSVVPWSKTTRVPGVDAPACVECPSNTANDKQLFEYAAEPKKGERELCNDRGNMVTADGGPYCLNGGCYARKGAAASKIIASKVPAVAKAVKKEEIGCSDAKLTSAGLMPAGVDGGAFARAVQKVAKPKSDTPHKAGGEKSRESNAYVDKWELENKARAYGQAELRKWEDALEPQLRDIFTTPVRRLAWMLMQGLRMNYGDKTVSPRIAALMRTAADATTLEHVLAIFEALPEYVELPSNDWSKNIYAAALDSLFPVYRRHALTVLGIKCDPEPDVEKLKAAKLKELQEADRAKAKETPKAPKAKKAAGRKGGGK